MTGLLAGLRGLGVARLVAMAAVAACVAGFLALLAVGGGAPRMAMLYGDLDLREAGAIAEALDAQHISHAEGAGGTRIDVPEGDVDRARMLLARAGLPSGGSMGYELLDRANGLMATESQEAMTRSRALEGELSRTLRTLSGVRAARVHLVLPKREPFARDRQEAQASILLTMSGAARLDPEGVRAVLNLVAAAVPGLRAQNIALVDNRGNVLARAGAPVDGAGAAAGTDELRRTTEIRLARAVEDMLERTLGTGRVRAEATVQMDVTQVHETQERFAPEEQVVRSVQTTSDNTKSTEAAPAVTVANNLPNADAGAGGAGAGSSEQRQDETTNYEIGKTVRTLVREQPEIRRVSLAVMVDGTLDGPKGADGAPTWQPRNADELARITTLVRGAVGFDEKRGDIVQVVSMRFQREPDADVVVVPRVLGVAIEGGLVARLAQIGVVGLLALLALAFVLRPMVLRLSATRTPDGLPGSAAGNRRAVDVARDGVTAAVADGRTRGETDALTGPGDTALLEGPDDGLIEVASVDGQLRASSLRRIAGLVERHPEESLQIVRSWLQEPA